MDSNFPGLRWDYNCHVTSDATPNYNCIAWALNYERQVVWPDEDLQHGWPEEIVRDETVESFCSMFGLAGYSVCLSPDLEQGYEKIALYTKGDRVAHAARQLPDGQWTSKMGQGVDVTHKDPSILSGSAYGDPTVFMKRRRIFPPRAIPRMNPAPPLIIRP